MSCDASVCSRLGLVFGLVIAVVGLVSSSAACSGALQPTEQVSGLSPREQSMLSASTSAASSSAFQPTVSSMAPKAKSKNYSTKQQRITLVNSSSSSSSSGKSTSSVEITCVFIPIIQTEWQRSIWHPPLVWPPPGFDDDGEDMGMCGC